MLKGWILAINLVIACCGGTGFDKVEMTYEDPFGFTTTWIQQGTMVVGKTEFDNRDAVQIYDYSITEEGKLYPEVKFDSERFYRGVIQMTTGI